MIFFSVIIMCGILSVVALIYPSYLLAIVGGGSWFGLLAYIVNNPADTFATGSTEQQMLLLVIGGAGMVVAIMGVMRTINQNREIQSEVDYYAGEDEVQSPRNYTALMQARRQNQNIVSSESADDYRRRLRSRLPALNKRSRG